MADGSKLDLIETIVEHLPEPRVRAAVMAQSPWLAVACWPSLKLAQLLFFGDNHRDLSVLVLEDLGWRRYEDYPLTSDQRLFDDRDEVDRYLRARLLNEATRNLEQWRDWPNRCPRRWRSAPRCPPAWRRRP